MIFGYAEVMTSATAGNGNNSGSDVMTPDVTISRKRAEIAALARGDGT